MLIELADQRLLLALARRALEAHVRRQPDPDAWRHGPFIPPSGAFVSLRRDGALRACLGHLQGDVPLASRIVRLAVAVADGDPRFAPVTAAELALLDIEISVLSPEHEVARIGEIEIGRHGLIVAQGSRRAVLLPHVATEFGWDVQEFLGQTCIKAELPDDAWQHGARTWVFEAQVFSEREQERQAARARAHS